MGETAHHRASAAAGFVYLFVPIFVIVAFSFNKPTGKFNIVWQEFTLDNWRNPLQNEALTDAMVLSLKIALISAVIATILGGLVALALVRYRFQRRQRDQPAVGASPDHP